MILHRHRIHSQPLAWVQPHRSPPQALPRSMMEPSEAQSRHQVRFLRAVGVSRHLPLCYLFKQEETPSANGTRCSPTSHLPPGTEQPSSIPGGLRGLQLQLTVTPIHTLKDFLQGEQNDLWHRDDSVREQARAPSTLISRGNQLSRPESVTTSYLSNVYSLCKAVSR